MSARDFLRNAADRFDLKIGLTADGLEDWDHGIIAEPKGALRTGSLDEPDPSARAMRLAAAIAANRRGLMVRIPGRHLDDVNVLVRAGVDGGANLLDGLVAEDGYAYLIWSGRDAASKPPFAQLISCRIRELIGDSVDRAEEARTSAEAEIARLSVELTKLRAAREQLVALQDEIPSREARVADLTNARDAADAKVARLSAELATLKDAREQCVTLRAKIEAQDEQIAELIAQVAALEDVREDAAVAARELGYATSTVEELRAQNHRLQRTLNSERKRAADLDAKRRESLLRGQRLQAEKESLESSTSYRLGRTLIDALRSPRGFLALPVRLLRLVRDWRRTRAVTDPTVTETARTKPRPSETLERDGLLERLMVQPLQGDVAFVPSALLASMLPPDDSRILEPMTGAVRIRSAKPRLLLIDDHHAGAGTPWAGCLRGPSEGDDSRLRETIDAAKASGCRIVLWHTDPDLPVAAFRDLSTAADRIVHTSSGDRGADVAVHAIPHRIILDPGLSRIPEALGYPLDPWTNLLHQAHAADEIRRAELLLDACLETSIARFLDEPSDPVLPRCRVSLVASGGRALLTSYHVASGLRARGYEPRTVPTPDDAADRGDEDVGGELVVCCDTPVTARAVLMLLAWSVVCRVEQCALFLRGNEAGRACAVLRTAGRLDLAEWPVSPATEDLVLDKFRGATG